MSKPWLTPLVHLGDLAGAGLIIELRLRVRTFL